MMRCSLIFFMHLTLLEKKQQKLVPWGSKLCITIKGNRQGIGHGVGNYVFVATKLIDGEYVLDFSDGGYKEK